MAGKRKTLNAFAGKKVATTIVAAGSGGVGGGGGSGGASTVTVTYPKAARDHVVELHRDADRKWYWTRRSSNGVIVAESHRLWPRRGDAERNLQAVNAHPFRLVDTTQETNA